MRHKSDTTTSDAVEIADRQHGVITLSQLEEVGLNRYAVAKRAERGHLHRIHQGIYAVGHRAPNLHARFMAAVLACGPGAVLSHASAAILWKFLKPIDGPVHVSIPSTSGRRRRRGIHLHRCPSLDQPQPLLTTHPDQIPVTTFPRTIEDLQSTSLPPRLVRRAKRQAELMGHQLPGVESDRTRSDLETLFLDLCALNRPTCHQGRVHGRDSRGWRRCGNRAGRRGGRIGDRTRGHGGSSLQTCCASPTAAGGRSGTGGLGGACRAVGSGNKSKFPVGACATCGPRFSSLGPV